MLDKIPSITDSFFYTSFCLSSQNSSSLSRIGKTEDNITRSSSDYFIRNMFLSNSLYHNNHLKYACSLPRSYIKYIKHSSIYHFITSSFYRLKGRYMRLCKIHNMNIISDTGSIRSRIIITKDFYIRKFTSSYLENIWQEIIGNTIRIFTKQSAWMGADRIKIS